MNEPSDISMYLPQERREHHHYAHDLGTRIGDGVTAFAGSWWFLLVHLFWWAPWILFQVEPFPFGLLTMILSLEAIVLSTVIMISQNRQAAKDRAMAKQDDEEIAQLLSLNQGQYQTMQELDKLQREQMASHAEQLAILREWKAAQAVNSGKR